MTERKRGQKICENCGEVNGVRAYECKKCDYPFKMKKYRKGNKKKKVEDHMTLNKGDLIRVVGGSGPFYTGEDGDKIYLVMRVYFEKPRTTVGWKGLINDPNLDETFDIPKGLETARSLLAKINEMGMPAASEFLDPVVPHYFEDLVSWVAIGARTTESQTHRQMASAIGIPVGFKNGTDGNFQTAIDGIIAARGQHSYVGTGPDGHVCVLRTDGNADGHLVLRGGNRGPNYDAESISEACEVMRAADLKQRVVVDCSHGNSDKDHKKQPGVFENVVLYSLYVVLHDHKE